MEAQDYKNLVKALRCKRDDCEGCDLSFFDKDEGWMCQYAAKDDDAADAIEALQAEEKSRKENCEKCGDVTRKVIIDLQGIIADLRAQLPKRGNGCDVCRNGNLEEGDTLFKSSDWDGGIGFDYIRDIRFCPICGRMLEVQDGQK